jgi:uncharacterized protein YbjT (DUF2867 family)
VKILLTGATGYVGSQLAPRLLAAGHDVRVLVRDPGRLPIAPWTADVDVVRADVLERNTLRVALEGVDAAYYLVHSMNGASTTFQDQDRLAGLAFGEAASQAGLGRLVYLGALGDPGAQLTPHLRSRHETGAALAAAGVSVLELRAGPIVGAGSLPFEMVRYLTERVPIMVCPRWVYTKVQPIGLADALSYLEGGLAIPLGGHEIVEVGGGDVLTYSDMMLLYARKRGLRRRMLRAPVLTPRLSSYWVKWVTPLSASYARPLVEGLRNEVIVRDVRARALFPDIEPVTYDKAVSQALSDLHPDAMTPSPQPCPKEHSALSSTHSRGMIVERRTISSSKDQAELFQAVLEVGGRAGWYLDWAWRLRGAVDRLLGGVGLRRSGRHELEMEGELDFWRVEALSPGRRRLLLKAEMRMPGDAWLEFAIAPGPEKGSVLQQTTYFAPRGLAGILYWYGLLPIHRLIFRGMARRLACANERWSSKSTTT